MIQRRQRACPHLCGGDGEARGVIRTRPPLLAQLYQVLDVLDGPQNVIPHVLQGQSFIVGTHALGRAAPALGPILVMLLLCEVEERQS